MRKQMFLSSLLFLATCCIIVIPGLRAPLHAQACYCGFDFCGGCVDSGGLCDAALCTCKYKTPIIIDVDGMGYHLTSAADGVMFKFSPKLAPIRVGWTSAGSNNAFLALDRNGNGTIDDSTELFGSFTPQPTSAYPNGFKALAEYDKPQNGGNGDGFINSGDAVFTKLRLWIDLNHDGISQPAELFPLPVLGIYSISLDYQYTSTFDQFGNMFRFSALVNAELKTSRLAYDVLLTTH